MIHPTAIVSPNADIGQNVSIGPFCIVEDDVRIGEGCVLHSHACVRAGTVLGKNARVGAFTAIGGEPQDLGFDTSVKSGVIVGDGAVFHEGVTVHRATKPGEHTRIGENCLLMSYAHMGHDSVVADRVIIASGALLGGHAHIEDYAFISGNVAVHQGCLVGESAMISGNVAISMDVPPFCNVAVRNMVAGLNLIGLRRRKFPTETILEIKRCYFKVFGDTGSPVKYAQEELDNNPNLSPQAKRFLQFFVNKRHGIVRPLQRYKGSAAAEE